MIVIATINDWTARVGGEPHTGWLAAGAAVPADTPPRSLVLNLRILREDGENAGYLLVWEAKTGDDSGDTWHRTLEEAYAQASQSFDIPEAAWQVSQ